MNITIISLARVARMPRRPTGIPKAHECRNSLTDLGGQDERIGPLGLLNDQVDGQLYVAIQ
jgi:hypothetical protein